MKNINCKRNKISIRLLNLIVGMFLCNALDAAEREQHVCYQCNNSGGGLEQHVGALNTPDYGSVETSIEADSRLNSCCEKYAKLMKKIVMLCDEFGEQDQRIEREKNLICFLSQYCHPMWYR